MDENGSLTGIDVDLATEAFSRLGYQPRFVQLDWEEKQTMLHQGDIDCIWSCFSMTGREADYQWAGPYMVSRQVIAVNPDSDIVSLSDLAGKTVAVQTDTMPEEILLGLHGGQVPQIGELYSLEDRDLIYAAVGKGFADAAAAHEASVLHYMRDYGVTFRILEESLLDVGIGVAFDLEDTRPLAGQLNDVLEEMRQDGTTQQILSRYLTDTSGYLEVERLET